VAKLSGPSNGTIAIVRDAKDKYHVVAPKELGGTRAVPADSLTDGLHQAVYEMSEAAQKKNRGGRKR
jgi:hypothetical protein